MNIGVIGTGDIGEVIENADYQTQANAFRSLFNEKMKQ